eukprot:m.128308 g.128308  ORF g.128308 m.128308 type:complete len:158 (+) comp29324_c1_seq1:241-714(+)
MAASVRKAHTLQGSLRVSKRLLAQNTIETIAHDFGDASTDKSRGIPGRGKRSKNTSMPTQTSTHTAGPTPTSAPTPTLKMTASNKRRKIKQEEVHANSDFSPHVNIKSELPMTPPATQTNLKAELSHVYDRNTIVMKQESPSTTSSSTSNQQRRHQQ